MALKASIKDCENQCENHKGTNENSLGSWGLGGNMRAFRHETQAFSLIILIPAVLRLVCSTLLLFIANKVTGLHCSSK